MTPQVTVLLASYHSEKYLKEQLDSIFRQTFSSWKILAGDGGSSDSTPRILREYAENYPEKFEIAPSAGRLSCTENFLRLLNLCKTSRAMFSDHDDVWMPQKMEAEMRFMDDQESRTPGKPVLVYTDMSLRGKNMEPVAESLFRSWEVPDSFEYSVPALTTYPVASGCTFLMNRPLMERCRNLPVEKYPVYDVLIALRNRVAGGCFVFCPGEWIRHRIHGGNLSGIGTMNKNVFLRKLAVLSRMKKERELFDGMLRAVADMTLEEAENILPADVAGCARAAKVSGIGRAAILFKAWHGMIPFSILLQKLPLMLSGSRSPGGENPGK